MPESIEFWDGNDWQMFASRLLQIRHPNGDFQETPSEYRGDIGFDGFSRSAGRAYQCYAAQEPLDHATRHTKQRDKIRVDTQKLIDRADDVRALLGSTRLARWTLVVPYFTSTPLLQYCTARTSELQASGLSFLAGSFEITVEQRSAFAVENAQLNGSSPAIVRLPHDPVLPSATTDFTFRKPDFRANLESKLESVLDSESAASTVDSLIHQAVHSQNLEEHLRSYGPLFEVLQDIRRRRQQSLRGLSTVVETDPRRRLDHVMASTKNDLEQRLGALLAVDRDALAEGLVIDWLGQCPLTLR